jgi:hypothetical protein
LVDSPLSQAERPRRKAPKMMRRINPRMVSVTTTSIRVNPVVEKAWLPEVIHQFFIRPLILFPRSISYLNYRVNPVVRGKLLLELDNPFLNFRFDISLLSIYTVNDGVNPLLNESPVVTLNLIQGLLTQ